MNIGITLDGAIRDIESSWKAFISDSSQDFVKTAISKEWIDYKSLLSPVDDCETTINDWYDIGHKIYVLLKPDTNNKKWLKDHYIPYDKLIDTYSVAEQIHYFVDSNMERCLDFTARKELIQSFCVNEDSCCNYFNINSKSVCSKFISAKVWKNIIIK